VFDNLSRIYTSTLNNTSPLQLRKIRIGGESSLDCFLFKTVLVKKNRNDFVKKISKLKCHTNIPSV
jgi:hypothetical protein